MTGAVREGDGIVQIAVFHDEQRGHDLSDAGGRGAVIGVLLIQDDAGTHLHQDPEVRYDLGRFGQLCGIGEPCRSRCERRQHRFRSG